MEDTIRADQPMEGPLSLLRHSDEAARKAMCGRVIEMLKATHAGLVAICQANEYDKARRNGLLIIDLATQIQIEQRVNEMLRYARPLVKATAVAVLEALTHDQPRTPAPLLIAEAEMETRILDWFGLLPPDDAQRQRDAIKQEAEIPSRTAG